MYCWDPYLSNVCSTKSSAAPGTSCGHKKVCIKNIGKKSVSDNYFGNSTLSMSFYYSIETLKKGSTVIQSSLRFNLISKLPKLITY